MSIYDQLPLKEWYLLAAELGRLAGIMIETGRALDSLPDDTPELLKRRLAYYMRRVIDAEDGSSFDNILSILQNDLDEYAASMEHHGDITEEEYESSHSIT